MATIVGRVTTSHVPAIGRRHRARACSRTRTGSRSSTAIRRCAQWLAKAKPDVAVVFYQDHGLNFFLDKPCRRSRSAPRPSTATPTRAGASRRVRPFRGDPALSWHLIETLVADEFDITTCQEMLVDHALTLPMALLWPGGGDWPVRIVPIAMNHVQHPLPSPKRSYRARAIGRPRARELARGRARRRGRHRRALAPARRHSARASSTSRST